MKKKYHSGGDWGEWTTAISSMFKNYKRNDDFKSYLIMSDSAKLTLKQKLIIH